MFLLLSSYLLAKHVQAVPITTLTSSISSHYAEFVSRAPAASSDQRSIWDIIWSCLTTIFACSWIAVHPNIPAIHDSYWKIMRRRLKLMFWGIVAPEVLIYWAMRQWLGARRIKEESREHGWTRTHGFFLQMGGFMLYEGKNPLHPLSFEELIRLHEQNKVLWPQINEREIADRSKGDFLSKGFVLLQTTWFIAQCIARGVTGMVITELELVTLAFAFLNCSMYFFWWNKPLDVQVPVPVLLISSESEEEKSGSPSSENLSDEKPDGTGSNAELVSKVQGKSTNTGDQDDNPSRLLSAHSEKSNSEPCSKASASGERPQKVEEQEILKTDRLPAKVRDEEIPPRSFARRFLSGVFCFFKSILLLVVHFPVAFIRMLRKEITEEGSFIAIWIIFVYRPFLYFTESLEDMLESDRSAVIEPHATRVHTFYARKKLVDNHMSDTFLTTLAIIFGGIHCIAWNFDFPSHAEKVIWRLGAVTTVGIPASFLVLGLGSLAFPFLGARFEQFGDDPIQTLKDMRWWEAIIMLFFMLSTLLTFSVVPLYILARLSLLVQAFICLRELSPGAYETIDWTTFIPHL